MILGVFLLMTILSMFVITHFLKFTADQPPLHLAAELSVILLGGMFMIAVLIMVRHHL